MNKLFWVPLSPDHKLHTPKYQAGVYLYMKFGHRQQHALLLFCFVCHIYLPFTRKRIVLLYFGREVRTRLGVAFSRFMGHLSST